MILALPLCMTRTSIGSPRSCSAVPPASMSRFTHHSMPNLSIPTRPQHPDRRAARETTTLTRVQTALAFQLGQVVFRLQAPEADRVRLVADFAGWEAQPIDLRSMGDGYWQVTVELPAGRYAFRFLVEGDWQDDPECAEYEFNPFATV